jgi:ubiquinone/menaquinone biosynthesis C-methylase UbiE
MGIIRLISTAFSTRKYYTALNETYEDVYGKHMMLHYPMYMNKNETLERRQLNLTDYCLSKTECLSKKTILEVGCGNGIQSMYVAEKFAPHTVIGVDLNPDNIKLAQENSQGRNNLHFYVDDAHKLDQIADNSIDVAICIESAFHYPQKELFLKQVERVLKPNGKFIIADIINKSSSRKQLGVWKRSMAFHHWTEEQYVQSFEESKLELQHKENITSQVVKGYQGHGGWIGRVNFNSWLHYQMCRLFAVILIGINIYLLKRKENYLLLAGTKS